MAFREFTFPQVLTKLSLTIQDLEIPGDLSPFPLRDDFIASIQEGLGVAVGDLGICTEKAKSEFLIAPILLELRRVLLRRFCIFSGMELNVEKRRGLTGTCDFILTKGDNQYLREAPIIAVLEAKNDVHSYPALGQCIAGMVGAQLRNQKAGWPIPSVFGAVTSGRAWTFLRLEGAVVYRDRTTHYLSDLPALMGILAHLVETALGSGSIITAEIRPQVALAGES